MKIMLNSFAGNFHVRRLLANKVSKFSHVGKIRNIFEHALEKFMRTLATFERLRLAPTSAALSRHRGATLAQLGRDSSNI